LVIALLALVTPMTMRAANTDVAIKASAVLAAFWIAIVVFAFAKFKMRAIWFLLGTPLICFWLFVLFLIAWGCAHTVKACP
jgi:hypothetical protein